MTNVYHRKCDFGGLEKNMKNCHDKFLEMYADYPSQDNEGFKPHRGGYKCGFFDAWRCQQEEIDQLKENQGSLIGERDRLRADGIEMLNELD